MLAKDLQQKKELNESQGKRAHASSDADSFNMLYITA